ncbi:MAG: hypothetical protein FWE37_05015 [Spirochaetaceae bacterium]|nr:hypothetical protein [Spirochaetaceae bacterium]
MKKLLFLIIITLLIVLAFLWQGDWINQLLFGRVQQVTTQLTLENITDLEQLETASITQEFLFPYDFIPSPYPNWTQLRARMLTTPLLRNSDFMGLTHEELMVIVRQHNLPFTETEIRQYSFYMAILNLGIDLNRQGQFFFPLVFRATAGFNLTEGWLSRQDDVITIRLPEAAILSYHIESGLSVRPGWPPVALTPELWGALVAYLQPLMKEQVTADLLTLATDNGHTILKSAFFSGIIIEEESE